MLTLLFYSTWTLAFDRHSERGDNQEWIGYGGGGAGVIILTDNGTAFENERFFNERHRIFLIPVIRPHAQLFKVSPLS